MSGSTEDKSIHSTRRIRRVSTVLGWSVGLLFVPGYTHLKAQIPTAQSAPIRSSAGNSEATESDVRHIGDIENRLNEMTGALLETQQLLARSLNEIQKLRAEIETVRSGENATAQKPPASVDPAAGNINDPHGDDVKALHEQVDAIEAEIKQHDQTKVETASKYPLRVTGLALFNAFSNAGVVDNAELPTFALPRNPGSSHGSAGGTLRQTLLTLEASGPRLWGARSSADISIDFFGGVASNQFGYSSTAGLVRMRKAQLSLDWPNTTARVGFTGPLISPLSPTSYATIAQPALAGSGNLWTWSPQLSIEQRIPLSEQHALAFEAGLIAPLSPGYTSIQLDSPVEAYRRPGYEGRISYHAHASASGDAHPFVLGVGGYSASQFYNSTTQVHAWAVTGDWQVPLTKWLELAGEAYRGSALGGLGGSAYKDVLSGTDAFSGLSRTIGADSVGGWSQLKLRLGSTLEGNAMFGMDDALSENFDGLVLYTSANPFELYARNQSIVGNVVFRPKTYLIFSPEYRRLRSWRYTGAANVANIFSLTAGYQF